MIVPDAQKAAKSEYGASDLAADLVEVARSILAEACRGYRHTRNDAVPSAERSGLPEMETARSELPGYSEHLGFACFQRYLLGQHDISDRQGADWHEA